MARKIQVTRESATGRNTRFKAPRQKELTRAELVRQIERGKHPDYHVRKVNGVKTPVSNPDGSRANNLG